MEDGEPLNEGAANDFLNVEQDVRLLAQVDIAAKGQIIAQWGDLKTRCTVAIFHGDQTVTYVDRTQGSETQKLVFDGGTVHESEFRQILLELDNAKNG